MGQGHREQQSDRSTDTPVTSDGEEAVMTNQVQSIGWAVSEVGEEGSKRLGVGAERWRSIDEEQSSCS